MNSAKTTMTKIVTLDALDMESLCSPNDLKREIPASSHHLEFIADSRRQIQRILDGEDNRLLLIVGPCSIHDTKASLEYASKLRGLSEKISRHFYVVMRAYFEKPRTDLGWKGMLYDPDLNGSNDASRGLREVREFLLKLTKMEVPAATEFLDPAIPRYYGDLIAWACIGARTAESQVHRQLASGLPMPIAFKNSTSGNIDVAVNGVRSAASPHAFFGVNDAGKLAIINTRGNSHAHIVLRGGETKPNYDAQSIVQALEKLTLNHLPRRVIIDCSHGNSRRNHLEQITVFRYVLEQHLQGNHGIRGLILESHLFGGNQRLADKSRLQYAVSITDPCLDWETTERLLDWGAEAIASFFTQNASVRRV